jgi:hypothetical protein
MPGKKLVQTCALRRQKMVWTGAKTALAFAQSDNLKQGLGKEW